MNLLVKVLSSSLNKAQRVIKALCMGDSDVQEIYESAPFGVDSSPVAGMTAVYAETLDSADPVIVGYLNEKQMASPGEMRIYSTDASGNIKTYTWLRSDGTIEIGGSEHNLTRYKPLNDGLQELVSFINEQLSLIATGITAGGGSYTPGTASLDITEAKINEIKTL